MNIDFEKASYKFNVRTSAIIYNKDKTKILLFKVEDGRDYFLLPGGRIELYEDSLTAIKREMKEELGFDLDYKLCSIQENFVTKKGKKIMQYCFCYKAIYGGETNIQKIKCKDNKNQTFLWVSLNDISNYKIYPVATYNLIDSEDEIIQHFIEKVDE